MMLNKSSIYYRANHFDGIETFKTLILVKRKSDIKNNRFVGIKWGGLNEVEKLLLINI